MSSNDASNGTICVSVVVPTCDRPDLLNRCLAALITQKYDPADYEIIVADDGASASVRAMVERWAERVHTSVRYIPVCGKHGPAAARNVGWRAARGDVTAFTDDDCVPEPGWLAAGMATMGEGIAGGCGRIVMPLPARPTDYHRDAARLQDAQFATANCFYRREILAQCGGFDERFTSAWREDSDLFLTLLGRGHRLVRVPDAVVVHPPRRAPWGISLRQQRKAMFNALLYKKHPALYRRHIQPMPPWRYYLIVLSIAALVIGLLAGQQSIAVGGGVVWLLLTGLFCAQRLWRTSRSPVHLAEMVVTSALIPPLAVYWRLYGAWKYRVLFL